MVTGVQTCALPISNTILSKSNDLKISDTGISLKTDIEKVREQIQNIE